MSELIYGIHIRTLDNDVARHLHDSFSHNEITADDIVRKWNSGTDEREETKAEVIAESWHPHFTEDNKFAVVFDLYEYCCDLYRVIK